VTTYAVLGGRWWTPLDSDQPVDAVLAEAMRMSLCLRDEETHVYADKVCADQSVDKCRIVS
jgi:hypothetical protein